MSLSSRGMYEISPTEGRRRTGIKEDVERWETGHHDGCCGKLFQMSLKDSLSQELGNYHLPTLASIIDHRKNQRGSTWSNFGLTSITRTMATMMMIVPNENMTTKANLCFLVI